MYVYVHVACKPCVRHRPPVNVKQVSAPDEAPRFLASAVIGCDPEHRESSKPLLTPGAVCEASMGSGDEETCGVRGQGQEAGASDEAAGGSDAR